MTLNNNNNNNDNNGFQTTFPHHKLCSQGTSLEDSPFTEVGQGNSPPASKSTFERLERCDVNSEVLCLTDSEVGYSTEVFNLTDVDKSIKGENFITSDSLIRQKNKDAHCEKQCISNKVTLKEVNAAGFPFEGKLPGGKESMKYVKTLGVISCDLAAAEFLPGNDRIGLFGFYSTNRKC